MISVHSKKYPMDYTSPGKRTKTCLGCGYMIPMKKDRSYNNVLGCMKYNRVLSTVGKTYPAMLSECEQDYPDIFNVRTARREVIEWVELPIK